MTDAEQPTDLILPSEPVEAAPVEQPPDPADDWRIGSSRQLPRLLSGHCISCANWSSTTGSKGTCAAIPATKNDKLVTVPAGEVTTDATFGCNLHAEIAPALFVDPVPGETPAGFGREETALMERTDLALALGLLPGAPDGFAGGGPGIERERVRREQRRTRTG